MVVSEDPEGGSIRILHVARDIAEREIDRREAERNGEQSSAFPEA